MQHRQLPRGAVRTKQTTQPEFIFQVPPPAKITEDYFARYDFISAFLDSHREIVDRVHRDLRRPLARAQRKGPQGQTCSFSSDTVLRLCLVKVLEGTSYRGTIVRVDDSPRLREFTRIHNGPTPSPATFNRLANAIRPRTWDAVNALVAQAAVTEGLITGEHLRLDTTATGRPTRGCCGTRTGSSSGTCRPSASSPPGSSPTSASTPGGRSSFTAGSRAAHGGEPRGPDESGFGTTGV